MLHRPSTQWGNWQGMRKRRLTAGGSRRRLVGFRPAAGHEDAASQAVSAGQAIDPAHGHGPVWAASFRPATMASRPSIRRLSPQIQGEGMRRMGNSTSRMWPVNPMPPTVARKSSRFVLGGTFQHPPVRHAELEAPDVLAKAAVDVMILAVDVGSDHAAQGDELRARRDGHEPAAAQQQAIQGQQRHAGLAPQHAGLPRRRPAAGRPPSCWPRRGRAGPAATSLRRNGPARGRASPRAVICSSCSDLQLRRRRPRGISPAGKPRQVSGVGHWSQSWFRRKRTLHGRAQCSQRSRPAPMARPPLGDGDACASTRPTHEPQHLLMLGTGGEACAGA